ncbi:MAG: acyl-CoA thioesterase, partial [Halobacteriaceae archaeon]
TVTDIGTSSITMDYTLKSNDAEMATAQTTMVILDDQNNDPVPLPDAWRNCIQDFEENIS